MIPTEPVMKTKPNQIFQKNIFCRGLILLGLSVLCGTSQAASITKADGSAATLTNSAAWVGGVPPGSTDIAVWDSTVLAAYTLNLGATTNWAGIQILNPGGAVTITNVNTTLLIGGSGVDTSGGSQTLTLSCPVSLATNNVNSPWNIVSGVTIGGSLNGTNILQKTGSGTLTLTTTSGSATIQIDSGIVSLNAGSGITNSLNGGTVNVNAAVGNPINVMAGGGTEQNTGGNRTWSGALSGSGPLTVIASSTHTWTGNNTAYSGTMTLQGSGALRLSSVNSVSASTAYNFNGGTMNANAAGLFNLGSLSGASGNIGSPANQNFSIGALGTDTTFSGVINGAGLIIKTGAGTLTLDGANTYTGFTIISNGVVQIGSGGTSGKLASPAITNNTVLSLNRSDVVTFTNLIVGPGSVRHVGSGTTTLTAANTYSGGTTLSNGILKFVTGTLGTGGVNFSGGTLQWGTSTTADISSQTVTINSPGGTVDVNGNSVAFANAIGNSGSGVLTVQSTTANGVLNLQSANTYTGGTTVSSGTLKVNNTTGSGVGSGGVTVASGATYGGNGIVSGTVEIQSSGIFAPGNSVGTNTVGGLTMDAGSLYNFEFNATPANDRVVVSTASGLTINGGAFNLYSEGGISPWTTPGTYNLVQFTGAIGGAGLDSGWTTASASNPHIANPQVGYKYAFGTSGGFLNVTITLDSTAVVATWTNNADGNWSVAANWSSNPNVPHLAGDSATFGISTALRTVTLNANETNGAVTFNNNNSFVIANSGKTLTLDNNASGAPINVAAGTANAIQTAVALHDNVTVTVNGGKSLSVSGVVSNTSTSKTLTLSGAGTLALSGNNSYGPAAGSVGTTLNSGPTLQVGHNNALGAGDVNVVGNGTLQAGAAGLTVSNNVTVASGVAATVDNNGNNLTLGGVISGSGGGLTKTGNGTLTLSGANSFSGNATVNAGALSIADNSNVGSTPNIILNGGELLGNGTFTLDASHTIGLGTVAGTTGTNGLIDAASGQVFTVGGVIASAGNSGVNGLVINSGAGDNGTVVLANANTFNGMTTISNGTLQLANSTALQNSILNYNTGTLLFDPAIGTATLSGLTSTNVNSSIGLTNLSSSPVALTVGNNGASTAYAGVLSDGGLLGSLIKVGGGTFILSGSNSYSGATTLSAGTLMLTNGGSINSFAGVTINGGGGAQFNLNGGALNGASMIMNNNSVGFIQSSGTASFSGNVGFANDNANNGNSLQILGGTFNANSLTSGRTGLNISAQPGAGQGIGGQGIIISNAVVTITNTLGVGGRSSGANSSTSMRMDGGTVNVGGQTTITINNGGRWSVLDINGGTFTCTDTNGAGIQIGGGYAGASALFLVRAGIASVNQITFGDVAIQNNGTDVLNLTGGALYIGAGGIVITNPAPTFGTAITMSGGTVGASADWTSSLPITLTTNIATFKAADVANVAHNIVLSGVLSGAGGLTKTGNGTLTLSGANTYTNNTTVSAGILELQQPSLFTNSTVSVANGATLNLNFAGTNQVNALVLNGVGKPAGLYGNGTDPTFLAGAGKILVAPSINPNPPIMGVSVSGNVLTLSWPTNSGWTLQQQTNSLSVGLGTNWVDVPGSTSITSTNITMDPAKPTVFYRLKL